MAIVLIGCSGHRPPVRDGVPAPRAGDNGVSSAADGFTRQAGERWYAMYEDGVKIGWAKSSRHKGGGFLSAGGQYRIDLHQDMTFLINGYDHRFKNRLRMAFNTAPPHELMRYEIREDLNDHTTRREIVRSGQWFRITFEEGGRKSVRRIKAFDYALEDALSIALWSRQAPSIGASIQVVYIDPYKLTREEGTARLVSRESESEDNAQRRRYHIEHPAMGLGATLSVFSHDGELETCAYRQGYKMQHATEAEARAPNPREDLYVRNMLPITGTIGRSDEVRRVEFATDGHTWGLLSDASGQHLKRDPDGEGFRIVLERAEEFNEAAFASEIKKALEVPPALNRKGAALLKSARQALEGISGRKQQVERLLTFVDEAVVDSNEVISPNLAYALEKRKGDCSEHAALFEALARALAIPCRTVSGLVYMGDWAQCFGLHAWNEVVIDGSWHPVDVTRRAVDLPPFYIRFPLASHRREKLYRHVPRMNLQVLKVEKALSP